MPSRLGGRKTRKRPRSFTSFWAGGEIRPRAKVSTYSFQDGRKNLSPARNHAYTSTTSGWGAKSALAPNLAE